MPETPPRFLTLPQVAEELATSIAQTTALVRRGDLSAIKIGGRGQWRIERSRLEEFIQRCYEETARELQEHGWVGGDAEGYPPDREYRQEEGGVG